MQHPSSRSYPISLISPHPIRNDPDKGELHRCHTPNQRRLRGFHGDCFTQRKVWFRQITGVFADFLGSFSYWREGVKRALKGRNFMKFDKILINLSVSPA